MDVFKLYFGLLTLSSIVESYTIPCARVCQCDIRDDLIIADCSEKRLTELPIFDDYLARALTRIYLNKNYIKDIDSKVVNTWASLEIIDLLGNPLDCKQIWKIPKNVLLVSDCVLLTLPHTSTTRATTSAYDHMTTATTNSIPTTTYDAQETSVVTLQITESKYIQMHSLKHVLNK